MQIEPSYWNQSVSAHLLWQGKEYLTAISQSRQTHLNPAVQVLLGWHLGDGIFFYPFLASHFSLIFRIISLDLTFADYYNMFQSRHFSGRSNRSYDPNLY